MNDATKAWLLSELGTTTPITDLEIRYTRLGTARSVALEVLRERLAALRAQPATLSVTGVVNLGVAENIKAYERQIAALENGANPAPDETDTTGSGGRIAMLTLRERPRR